MELSPKASASPAHVAPLIPLYPTKAASPVPEVYVTLEGEKKKKKKKEKKEDVDDASSTSSSSSSSGLLSDVGDFFESSGKYFKQLNFEDELDKAISQQKVPRDAATERRCQMFSIFITLLSLLAILFFAMIKPVITNTVQPDEYLTLCSIDKVIPLWGTAQCSSTRSRADTEVTCLITCDYGVNKELIDDAFEVMNDQSFELTCTKTKALLYDDDWTYNVNDICNEDPDKIRNTK